MKILKVGLFLALIFVIGFGCQQKPQTEATPTTPPVSNEIKFGVMLPLTGSCATFGKNVQQGLELALQKLNSEGGFDGKQIKLLYEDTKCTAADGIIGINNLLKDPQLIGIIGDVVSTVSLAVAPIAQANGVVMLSPTSTNVRLRDAGDLFYRVCPSDASQGIYLARVAFDQLKAKKAAVLYQDNDYGVGLKDYFIETFLEKGGQIVDIEHFHSPDHPDLATAIDKIKARKPDLVFMPAYVHEAPQMLLKVKELGLNVTFLLSDAAHQQELLDVAGTVAEGVYVAALALGEGETDAEVSEFKKTYKARWGTEAETDAAYAFDALLIMAEATQLGGSPDKAGVARGMKMIQEFRGVTGITSFDEDGEVEKPILVHKVKNGAFVGIYE